jgi:hypothetical protein
MRHIVGQHRAQDGTTLLLATVLASAGAGAALEKPAWDFEMKSTTTCIEVPPTVNFTNNSRWAYVAVPQGDAPPGGWPVLIQLAIIPFQAAGERPTYNGSTKPCGMDGEAPAQFPWGGLRSQKRQQHLYHRTGVRPDGLTQAELARLPPPAPPGPPKPVSYWGCVSAMAQTVGYASWWREPHMSQAQQSYCMDAVHSTKPPNPRNPNGFSGPILPFLIANGCTMEIIERGCSPPDATCLERSSVIGSNNSYCQAQATNCTATKASKECPQGRYLPPSNKCQ